MANRKCAVPLLLFLVCIALTYLAVPAAAQTDTLARADAAFEAGDRAAAKPLYEQVFSERGAINDTVEQRGVNKRVLMRLGRCCFDLDLQSEGQNWLKRLVATYPSDREQCAAAQIWIAKSLIWELKHSEAASMLDSVLTDYSDQRSACARALSAKADLHVRLGQPELAVPVLQRLLADYPDQTKFCKPAGPLLAQLLDATLRTDEALELLTRLQSSDYYTESRKAEFLLEKAQVFLGASRYDECRAVCRSFLIDHETLDALCCRAKLVLAQAMCLDGYSDMDEALMLIEELRVSEEFQDHSFQAQFTLWRGGCHWQKKEYAAAEALFTKVIADFADQQEMVSDAYLHRARLRITALKSFDSAAQDIEMIEPSYLKHYAQAEWHFFQGDFSKAAPAYEACIAAVPPTRVPNIEPETAFRRLIRCYYKLGDSANEASARVRYADYSKVRE